MKIKVGDYIKIKHDDSDRFWHLWETDFKGKKTYGIVVDVKGDHAEIQLEGAIDKLDTDLFIRHNLEKDYERIRLNKIRQII